MFLFVSFKLTRCCSCSSSRHVSLIRIVRCGSTVFNNFLQLKRFILLLFFTWLIHLPQNCLDVPWADPSRAFTHYTNSFRTIFLAHNYVNRLKQMCLQSVFFFFARLVTKTQSAYRCLFAPNPNICSNFNPNECES